MSAGQQAREADSDSMPAPAINKGQGLLTRARQVVLQIGQIAGNGLSVASRRIQRHRRIDAGTPA